MKSLYLVVTVLFFSFYSTAQQFVDKAEIEFEVNTNVKKNMSNNSWDEMMKENLSELKTSYWTYSFANNKSLFKFNRWSEKTRIPKYQKDQDEEKSWYYDFNTNTMSSLKQVVGTSIVVSDSIVPIEWKITNENREIAGYNCRKAVGKSLAMFISLLFIQMILQLLALLFWLHYGLKTTQTSHLMKLSFH